MSITHLRFRLLMLAAGVGFLAVALAIRAVTSGALNSAGRLEQYSGTALYASMSYVGVLFLWPCSLPSHRRCKPGPSSAALSSMARCCAAYCQGEPLT